MHPVERCAIPMRGHQILRPGPGFQRQVGGVAIIGVEHHMTGLGHGLHQVEQGQRPHPRPTIIIARPGGDAVDIIQPFRLRQGLKRRPIEDQPVRHQPIHPQPPFVAANGGLHAQIQHREIGHQSLPRWQAGFRVGMRASQQAPFAGPFLLPGHQLLPAGGDGVCCDIVHGLLRHAGLGVQRPIRGAQWARH